MSVYRPKHTIWITLDGLARIQRLRQETYAQTWVPCSGMIVKRTSSSVSLTQAMFPSEDKEAVRPGVAVSKEVRIGKTDL